MSSNMGCSRRWLARALAVVVLGSTPAALAGPGPYNGNGGDKGEKNGRRWQPPENLSAPLLWGTAREESTLFSSDGVWSSLTAYQVEHQWLRCDPLGGSCAAIDGATARAYVLTRDDAGHMLRAAVIATNENGSTTSVSDPSGVVAFLPPSIVTAPAIAGDPVERGVLTASSGTWSGAITGFTWIWQRCDATGACVVLPANGNQDALTSADVGSTIQVTVTASGPGGSSSATSAAVGPVRYAAPLNVLPPSLAGTAQERQTLSAAPGTWQGEVSGLAYQWQRCDSSANCQPITTATSSTYLLTGADVGFQIAVDVIASGPGGSTTSRSAPTVPVIYAPPLNVAAPAIHLAGRTLSAPSDGQTLTATTGSWDGTVASYTYRWLRCDPTLASCEDTGATGTTDLVTDADVDSVVLVEVTATGPGGTTTARSAPSALVTGAATSMAAPAVSGLLVVGEVLTGTFGAATGTAPVDYALAWLRCDANGANCAAIDGATGPRYRMTETDAGARLRFQVTMTNPRGTTVAQSDPTATIDSAGAATGYQSAVLASAPAAYWRFDESSGTTVRDSSPNGVTGKYVTGYSLGASGAVAGDAAVSFNGTNGRASFGDVFDFVDNSPFTIESWIQPTVIDAWNRHIFGKQEKNTANAYEGYRFAMSSALGLYCERWSSNNNTGLVSWPAAHFAAGSWYHVACVYDGASLRLYVNGTQVVAKSSPQKVANTAAEVAVGAYSGGASSSFWAGGLDELAVYSRVLSASELSSHIQASASSAVTVASAPQVIGEVGVGEQLQATTGTWTGTGPLDFSYQWQRCDASGNGCVALAGATDAQYRITAADSGNTVRVQVVATGPSSSAIAISNVSAVVPAADPFLSCVEAEDAYASGAVTSSGPSANTRVLGSGGQLSARFILDRARNVSAWARVRTPQPGANAFQVSVRSSGSDGQDWTSPVTPVLRWQRLRPGAQTGLATVANWPGAWASGAHQLTVTAVDPGSEIDAVCITNDDRGPAERLDEAPQRALNKSVADFGAKGDGVSDDTAALAAAFASLKSGDGLYFPPGRYRFTSPLTVTTSNVSLVGEGPSTVLFADLPATITGHAVSLVGGYEGAQYPLTTAAQVLDRSLQIAPTSGIKVGDIVLVSADQYGPPAPYYPGLFYRNRQNLLHVTAISTSGSTETLTFDRPLLSPFDPVNNAKVQRFNGLSGVVVSNLKMEGTAQPVATDNANVDLLWASRCASCWFSDLEFASFRVAGLQVARSLDNQVIRVHSHDAVDTGGDGHGYGVAIAYSQATVVRDSLFDGRLRHGITVSWGSRETFVFGNTFDRSVADPNNFGSVDVHGQDDYANLIEANQLFGAATQGLVLGGGGTSHGNDGQWNVVRGNRIQGTGEGISVFKQTYDSILEDNLVVGTTTYAFRIESGSDRTQVSGNTVDGSVGLGVSVKDSASAAILHNDLDPASGPAIQIVNGPAAVVGDNVLHGGSVNLGGNVESAPSW